MKRILLTAVIACFVFTFSVKAQYDIRLSQYFMARTFYNPAYAGSTENLSISALSRIEWLGIHGAPKSFFVAADRPEFKPCDHAEGSSPPVWSAISCSLIRLAVRK